MRPDIAATGEDSSSQVYLPAVFSVLLSVFLVVMDVSIANVALPSLSQELAVSATSSVWVISAYQLSAMAILLPFAALGSQIGNRVVYIGGLMLFLASSLACGISQNLPELVLARFAQGLGAGAVMAVNAAILAELYPRHRLGRGIGWNTLVVGVAFAIGPVVCALLLTLAGWRWLFLINLPFGGLALWGCLKFLPRSSGRPGNFRKTASLLCFGLFLCLGLAAVLFSQHVWSAALFGAIAAGLGFALLLWRAERGQDLPLLPVDLLRNPMFSLSGVTAIFAFATQSAIFIALPFYFVHRLGMSELDTGLLLTPWSVAVALMAPLAGRWADRINPGPLGTAGFALIAASLLLFMAYQDVVAIIAVLMVAGGIGFALFQSPNQRALIANAPQHRRSAASGMVATVRLIGQSSGAVMTALCFLAGPEQGAFYALQAAVILSVLAGITSALRSKFRQA